jgi:hypothetical protein
MREVDEVRLVAFCGGGVVSWFRDATVKIMWILMMKDRLSNVHPVRGMGSDCGVP